jgi:O-antigen ligase
VLSLARPQYYRPYAGSAAFAVGAIGLVALLAAGLAVSGLSARQSIALTTGALAVAIGGAVWLKPAIGERLLLLYIFVSPLHFFVFGDTFVSIQRESFGFRLSASDMILPALLLALARNPLRLESPLRSRTLIALGALVLAITVSWGQSALYLGGLSGFSTGKFLGFVVLVVFAAAAIEGIRSEAMWRRAVDALALSGVACALVGIAGWLAWQLTGVVNPLISGDRLSSTMWADPNIFASMMAITLILAVTRAGLSNRSARWAWAGAAIIALLALLLSQSRSGVLAAGVGLLVLALAYRPGLTLSVAAGAAGCVVLVWATSMWVALPVHTGTLGVWNERRLSSDTVTTRIQFLDRAGSLLPSEGFTGIGVGSFEQTNPVQEGIGGVTYVRVHNTYLSALLELGVAGVIGIGLAAGAIVIAVRKGLRETVREDRWRLIGLVACLLGMMVFAVFVDALYQRQLWILAALLLAVPNFSAGERSPAAGVKS